MLVETLNVTLADLMPVKGVAVSLPGEPIPYLTCTAVVFENRDYGSGEAFGLDA